MAAAAEPSVWKTVMIDSFGLVVVLWSIPLAIIVVGAPIVFLVRLLASAVGWL